MPKPRKVTLCFTFPPEMADEIDQRSRSLGLTKSVYMRQLVRNDFVNPDVFEIMSNEAEKGVTNGQKLDQILELLKSMTEDRAVSPESKKVGASNENYDLEPKDRGPLELD